MFEEGGFEVYESTIKKYVTKDVYNEPDGLSKHMLDVREVLDEIKAKFYVLKANIVDWEDSAQEALKELEDDGYDVARL
ncbi:MAG: hypothetical protein Q9161_005891 [Pseudevernia consocians]